METGVWAVVIVPSTSAFSTILHRRTPCYCNIAFHGLAMPEQMLDAAMLRTFGRHMEA